MEPEPRPGELLKPIEAIFWRLTMLLSYQNEGGGTPDLPE